MKRLKNFKLDEETCAALAALVGVRGKDETEVVKTLILAARKDAPACVDSVKTDDPEREQQVVDDRVQRKAERKSRKMDLHSAVTQALGKSERASVLTADGSLYRLPLGAVPPCQHPAASRTAGKDWRCTRCGYQHKHAA